MYGGKGLNRNSDSQERMVWGLDMLFRVCISVEASDIGGGGDILMYEDYDRYLYIHWRG